MGQERSNTINMKNILDNMGAFIALIILVIIMSFLSPAFLRTQNILNILVHISTIAIMGIGMTFIILTGGIDLSVGSIAAFTALIMAVLMKAGVSVWAALLIGAAAGALQGWFNGSIISLLNIPPFIVTLGMMSIARGGAFTITSGRPVYTFPEAFPAIAGNVLGIPIPVFIMVVMYIIAWYVLNNTRFGRYVYALGGNETVCQLAGISVKTVKQAVYIISGFCCAAASVITTARLDSAVPVAFMGAELDAIAAVIIGGTSLAGGQGTLIGTIIGALIMGVVSNGLNLLIVPQGAQRIIKGAIIIIAVIIDIMRKRKKE